MVVKYVNQAYIMDFKVIALVKFLTFNFAEMAKEMLILRILPSLGFRSI
jgi:hypothetical protein